MKSIRWIQNVLIDGKPGSLEIMIGVQSIADRCYIRVNQESEFWFTALSTNRAEIIQQGLDLLKMQLSGHEVHSTDGNLYPWTAP